MLTEAQFLLAFFVDVYQNPSMFSGTFTTAAWPQPIKLRFVTELWHVSLMAS
jgi:hypothetical protein